MPSTTPDFSTVTGGGSSVRGTAAGVRTGGAIGLAERRGRSRATPLRRNIAGPRSFRFRPGVVEGAGGGSPGSGGGGAAGGLGRRSGDSRSGGNRFAGPRLRTFALFPR